LHKGFRKQAKGEVRTQIPSTEGGGEMECRSDKLKRAPEIPRADPYAMEHKKKR